MSRVYFYSHLLWNENKGAVTADWRYAINNFTFIFAKFTKDVNFVFYLHTLLPCKHTNVNKRSWFFPSNIILEHCRTFLVSPISFYRECQERAQNINFIENQIMKWKVKTILFTFFTRFKLFWRSIQNLMSWNDAETFKYPRHYEKIIHDLVSVCRREGQE